MKLIELLDLFIGRTIFTIRDGKCNVICKCELDNIPFNLLLKEVRSVEAIGENKAHIVLNYFKKED